MKPFCHPSERSLHAGRVTPREFFRAGQRCCLFGIGENNSNTSNSYDQRLITGGADSPVARDSGAIGTGGSFVLGQNTYYTEQGSLQATTANVGNITAGTGANVTIGVKEGTISDLVGQFTQASGQQAEAFNKTLAKSQDDLSALASDAKKNNAFAWIAAAAIAALVVPGLFKRI